jgi:hypothetical protein
MIFGWMDRDFYLEEHDPERWKVEAVSSSPTSKRIGSRGLIDAG